MKTTIEREVKKRGRAPYQNPDHKIQIGVKVDKRIWSRFKAVCNLMNVYAGDMLDSLILEWLKGLKEDIVSKLEAEDLETPTKRGK